MIIVESMVLFFVEFLPFRRGKVCFVFFSRIYEIFLFRCFVVCLVLSRWNAIVFFCFILSTLLSVSFRCSRVLFITFCSSLDLGKCMCDSDMKIQKKNTGNDETFTGAYIDEREKENERYQQERRPKRQTC